MSVVFNETHNGQTVAVAAGQTFAVHLDGNPTTGYQWEHKEHPGVTITKTYTTQPRNPDGPPICGAGGVYVWEITSTESFTFHATYKRAWEPAGVKEYVLTVTLA